MNYFDMHCDTLYECYETGGHLRGGTFAVSADGARQYDRYGQVFSLFCGARPPMGAIPGRRCLLDLPKNERFDALRRTAQQELDDNRDWLTLCGNRAQMEQAVAEGKAIALLSVEGAELLPERADAVAYAAACGVRLMNITWNDRNAFGAPSSLDERQHVAGNTSLTLRGRKLVQDCETQHIVLDVSHLSERGFWDLCEIAKRPFVASHSNAQALCGHYRNLTDAQFAEIMRRGGVVGINLYTPFVVEKSDCRMEDVLDHIEHFLGMYGETQLCMGADLDGCDALPAGIDRVQDVQKLAELMLQHGYKESTVNGLFYDNLFAFWKKALSESAEV